MQDKDAEPAAPPANEPATKEAPGKIEVDSRGRNVWRWTREANDSTSVVLKRLDNADLKLEPTQKIPIARQASAKAPAAKGATPKHKAAQGAAPTGNAAQGAAAKTNKNSAADAQTSKKRASHPALRPLDSDRDGGGGFDPYNSR
jgi:hypothetical protein